MLSYMFPLLGSSQHGLLFLEAPVLRIGDVLSFLE